MAGGNEGSSRMSSAHALDSQNNFCVQITMAEVVLLVLHCFSLRVQLEQLLHAADHGSCFNVFAALCLCLCAGASAWPCWGR
jgi:hypothetical protein